VGNSDVLRNSDVWLRGRPRGVARDREIQGQKYDAHMLQACGLGSTHWGGAARAVVLDGVWLGPEGGGGCVRVPLMGSHETLHPTPYTLHPTPETLVFIWGGI